MIKAIDLRKGRTILHGGELTVVHEARHVAKGNKGSYMQTKLRKLKSGTMIEVRFNVNERIEVPFVESKDYEFLYRDPDAGAVQRLPRRLPRNIAMEMLYLGRWLSAQEAASFGLVNLVVPADELLKKAREWANQIADSAPIAVAAMKEVTAGIEGLAPKAAYDALRAGGFASYERMLGSDDAKEGVNAFVEKRDASFKRE